MQNYIIFHKIKRGNAMKRILFISGSARNGNCKKILETLQSNFWLEYGTDVVYIRDFDLKPCNSCIHSDSDKMDILLDKVYDADIVVLATPNYFYNISGLTKMFIDKTLEAYNEKKLQGKKFIYIYIGSDDEKNTKKYLDNAMYGFTICHECNVLGSFAYSASGIDEFNNPNQASLTTQDIIAVIRENLED